MSLDKSNFGKMNLLEWKKSFRDFFVEWGIAMIPIAADFGIALVSGTETFLTAQGMVIVAGIFKVLAPFIKRWLNIYRIS